MDTYLNSFINKSSSINLNIVSDCINELNLTEMTLEIHSMNDLL